MRYIVCYSKTYYVEVESDSPEGAVAEWEDLDLEQIEDEVLEPEAVFQFVREMNQ